MSQFTKIQLIIGLSLIFGLFSCNQAPQGKKVEANNAEEISKNTAAATTLAVDTEASVVNWEGTKPTGDKHNGTIKIKSGNLMVNGEEITGGEFVLDMTSIAALNMPEKPAAKLVGHLSSGDFFETEKFPEATFTIASVDKSEDGSYTIKGNLAMKDSVKSIEIPANISMSEGGVEATTPSFTIDRTQWGVMFHSGVVGTVKEKLINDQVGLTINLVAKKEGA